MLALTDWKTDELFDVPGFSNRLIFPVNRLVCDPERFRDDCEESMVLRGMGAVYTHDAWRHKIRTASDAQRELLLKTYYDPHHQALEQMSRQVLAQYGCCLVLDCHSFPEFPLPYEPVQVYPRPDFCLGTDPAHTPPVLVERMTAFLQERGYTVSLNTPFAGTLLPLSLMDNPHLFGIMIEVNRRLYMKSNVFCKNYRFPQTKQTLSKLVQLAADIH